MITNQKEERQITHMKVNKQKITTTRNTFKRKQKKTNKNKQKQEEQKKNKRHNNNTPVSSTVRNASKSAIAAA